jgi:hypothetical protein
MSAINATQRLQPPDKAQPVSLPAGAYDPSVIPGQVKSWIEMVMQYAPEPHKTSLIQLVKQLV